MSYMTRALKARDPRFARVLGKLGYNRADVQADMAPPTPKPDEITMVRAEYERVVGKKAYHGWKADQLREKIAAAKAKA